MSELMYRMGRSAARRPLRVIAIWLVLAAAVIGGAGAFGAELEDRFEVPGSDSYAAAQLLDEAGSASAGPTAVVVATPRAGDTFAGSAAARSDLATLRSDLVSLPNVLSVDVPEAGAISADGRVAMLVVQYRTLDRIGVSDLHALNELRRATAGSALQVEMGGELFFALEEAETGIGEILGVIAAAVILFVAFGSLVAMGLPIGMALFGLALGVGSMSLVAYLVEIPAWAPSLGAMVGLGVGIDYALFIITAHRAQLARALPVDEAAGRAVASAGRAVLFAGGAVVIAILGLAVAGVPFITAAGVAIAVVVAIMVVAALTIVPALLGLVGPWINRLGLQLRGASATTGPSPRWERWGRHVTAHAGVYAVASTILLLALAAPVLALRVGFLDDGTAAESRTQRIAYDLAADGFGSGINGPLLVAVETAGDLDALDGLRDAIVADRGVVRVAEPRIDPAGGIATMVAIPTSAPRDEATVATVERLRAQVIPAALGESAARAYVGGQTATFADVSGRVGDRLPVLIVAVVLLSFILLTVMFRSVLVPLKAALLNLLSVGAAYGVLVMVFQWGWGLGLIGLESTVPIVSFLPLFLFAILFGLSMDYEVFLLSSIRERYLAGADNRTAVIQGVAGTARVITSAALIMIAVFAGFIMSGDPLIKMWGLGLATAILVDVTVIRLALAPATMTLLGRANWWFPALLGGARAAGRTANRADAPVGRHAHRA